jgi:hypothetical protein
VFYLVVKLITCVIVVHELCINENDLYVVVMSNLVSFHVDYYHALDASILWL